MMSRPTYYTPPAALLMLLFFIALPTPGNAQTATSTVDAADQLRAVGVQMKQALDHLDSATMPDRETLAGFDRALARSADAASTAGAALTEKRAALQRMRRQLEAKVHAGMAVGSAQPSATNPAAPARRDIETVVAKHGDTCANALGLSTTLPVELVLAAPGHGRSDAWLRFDATAASRVRFITDSSGADPAIAVFSSCAAGAEAFASNDDAFGLDAALTAATAPGQALFVHLSNSGAGGRVTLQVVNASATVSGTVLDAITNAPLSSVYIYVYANSYSGYVGGYTDQQGNYTISVSPGSYYVIAQGYSYVEQIYPAIACLPSYYSPIAGCPVAQAQALTLAAGGMATINFALNHGHSISGQLRDTANAPISVPAQPFVTLSNQNGMDIAIGNIDGFGRYSIGMLPPGSYRLRAGASGYGLQMFDHKTCAGQLQQTCDLSLATAINVADQDLRDFNFDLPLLASIVGTVTPAPSAGLYPLYPTVTISTASGNLVVQTSIDAAGNYRAGPLDPGTYYVSSAVSGYFSQLFSAVDCGENCIYSIPSGTAVTITGNGQSPRADFHLTPLPVLKGHIQDADTGLPLSNVTVDFSKTPPAQFQSVATTVTDNEGNFKVSVGAGHYYVWARSNDHIDQIFPNIPCEAGNNNYYGYPPITPCDVSGAAVLAVLPGVTQPALNFALVASSSFSGSVLLRAGPGSDLPAPLPVHVYNGAGVELASANVDTQGNYIVADLPAATYYAAAQNNYASYYVPQLWQLMDCHSNCVPTTGTPIPLARATTLTGINFQITQTDAVFGRVTDTHGNPVAGVLIDAFGSDGTYINTGTSDSQGYYRVETLAYGAFFVATEAGAKYTDQVYPAIACPAGPAFFGLCSLTGATPINLGVANAQPQIANFVLQATDKIFHNGFE